MGSSTMIKPTMQKKVQTPTALDWVLYLLAYVGNPAEIRLFILITENYQIR